MSEELGVDYGFGPVVPVWLEVDPDGENGLITEMRLPFVPRVGEMLTWGPMPADGGRHHCIIEDVSWVMHEPSEDGISRIRHVNLLGKWLPELEED